MYNIFPLLRHAKGTGHLASSNEFLVLMIVVASDAAIEKVYITVNSNVETGY